MVDKVLIGVACVALTFVFACSGSKTEQKSSNATPASGPAAAVQSNQYKGEGTVKAVNPNAPSIEINHGDIDGFMPAMQMEFPVTDPKLLNGIAVNDRIDFTVENDPEGVKVVAIKKLEIPSPQKAPN
jgi:Cu(I)/Ag(I) efflux system protein CusF